MKRKRRGGVITRTAEQSDRSAARSADDDSIRHRGHADFAAIMTAWRTVRFRDGQLGAACAADRPRARDGGRGAGAFKRRRCAAQSPPAAGAASLCARLRPPAPAPACRPPAARRPTHTQHGGRTSTRGVSGAHSWPTLKRPAPSRSARRSGIADRRAWPWVDRGLPPRCAVRPRRCSASA